MWKKLLTQRRSANNRAVIKFALFCKTELQIHTVKINFCYSISSLFWFEHETKDLAKKTYDEMEVELHAFLASMVDVGDWLASVIRLPCRK